MKALNPWQEKTFKLRRWLRHYEPPRKKDGAGYHPAPTTSRQRTSPTLTEKVLNAKLGFIPNEKGEGTP